MSKIPNKGAGNKAAEANGNIPEAYLKLHSVDKTNKATYSWIDVFNRAADKNIEGAHTAYKEADKVYKAGKDSISQQLLSFARVAGNVEQFNDVLKNMRTVYKLTNNKAVPQAIHDATTQIRKAWSMGIDPTKSTSIGTLKAQIKEAKELEKETSGEVEQPTEFSRAIVALGELHRQCKDLPALEGQLTSALNKVGTEFADILNKAIGEIKPVKKEKPATKAA